MILEKKKRNSVKLIINISEIEESKKKKKKSFYQVLQLINFYELYLTFNEHVDNLYRTSNYKLLALQRTRKYSSLEKAKKIGNLIMPHWCGCFAEKRQYLKIQKIHCKALWYIIVTKLR